MLGEHLCWLYRATIGCHGLFTVASSPFPEASEDESDYGFDSDDGSPSDDEMSTSYSCPFSLMTKRGSSFEMRVVILIGGGLV